MQTLSADQQVGSVLGGEYTIEQFLGRGALTAAYMGQQQSQNRRVLITIFLVPERFSAAMRERFNARFLREGKALIGLQHPHILPVYDCGEYDGSPYLVTAYSKDQSLARIIKEQPRFSVQETSELLQQLADGLDYAHRHGIIHGSLSPATVLLDEQRKASLAGFGFVRMLAMQGIEERNYPYAHLVNVANTFLGIPGSIAPESVQHPLIDARSDVYALGIMVFQLLSGVAPFTGSNPLEVALQRIQQPIPSLQAVAPDVPAALDSVLQRVLEQDPSKRFQSAGEFARAFTRVLKVTQQATIVPPIAAETAFDSQITQPPTVNWLEGSELAATGKTPAFSAKADTGSWQLTPPIKTAKFAAVSAASSASAPTNPVGEDVASIDPFVWWSTTEMHSVQAGQTGQVPGTFTQRKTTTRRKSTLKSRRRVIVLLASGGVVAAGVLGVTGVSLAHLMQKGAPSVAGGQATTQGNTATTGSTQATTPTTGAVQPSPTATKGQAATPTTGPKATPTAKPTSGAQAAPTPGAQATPTPVTQPTPTPQPTPTQQPPTPTPTPPQHTGTVIGSTNQPTNTAQSFTNPQDGQGSFLIHLPNGNFVAYEKACTHAGVLVNYDGGRQKLVCPAHGAVFDPANGGQVLQGPTNRPLPQVAIRVNADGTITTG